MLSRTTFKPYAIVVMSCDSYSDIWPYFAQCWDRFWPNCPFKTYLVSEQQSFVHDRIENIKTGRSMGWGEMLLHVLDRIDSDHMIYMQEDYLLKGPVDNSLIYDFIDIFEKTNAAYLRLLPWPEPDIPHPDYKEVGIITPDSKYSTSLQTAIWDKHILRQLVNIDDDGSFEVKSIERAKAIDRPFLSVKKRGDNVNINCTGPYPIDYFATTVFQGKWLKEGLKTFSSLGIKIDTSQRGVMKRIDMWQYKYRNANKGVKYWLGVIFYKAIMVLGY